MTGESNGSRNIVTCPAGAGDRRPAIATRNYLWPVEVHRSQPVSTPPSFSLSLALPLLPRSFPPSLFLSIAAEILRKIFSYCFLQSPSWLLLFSFSCIFLDFFWVGEIWYFRPFCVDDLISALWRLSFGSDHLLHSGMRMSLIVGVTCEDHNYFFRFRSCSRFLFCFVSVSFPSSFRVEGKSQEESVYFVSLEALAKRNSFRGCQRAGGLLLLVHVPVLKRFEKCVLRRTIDGFQ